MKFKNIFRAVTAVIAGGALLAACSVQEFEEVTEMSLTRCLEPQNLSAKVDVATGDYVTFGWDVNKDAETFNLVVCTDQSLTQEALNVTIEADAVPYTVRLTADQTYWFKVQALAERRAASNWAVYDGSTKTYAVKDNLFMEVTGRTSNSVSVSWSKDVSDYKEVTNIVATPVKGGSKVTYTLTSADIDAAAATVTGLASSTEYQLVLYYLSASRGASDVWTMAEAGTRTTISTAAEVQAAFATGGEFYLSYSADPVSMSTAKPTASVSIVGELGPDGEKPTLVGKIELTSDLTEDGADLYFENIKFDGNLGSRIVEHTSGAPVVNSVKFVNCEITNFLAGFLYENTGGMKLGTLSFDTCDMYGIVGSGGDAVDVRKACEIGSIVFRNNTMYDGIRTLFRIDAVDGLELGSVEFENNTVKNIATMDDGNNRGIFAIRVATEMSLKNNLFLWEDGGKTDDTDRAQLFQVNANTVVPTLNASGNYSYAHGKDFFTKVTAAEAGFKELPGDPCYNSKGNFFQLANDDLISAKVGASKWWISYVEKTEDLTQNVIEGPHTWNLLDASLFAGDIKNSRVRDELLLVGTEATPMKADGGIAFTTASALTRKGVPTEGYAAFKVNTAGSVDIEVKDGGASSVVVALQDDGGFSVIGGAMASSNAGVQKIVIPSVSGEGMIYLYSTGAITISKLAWSLDTKAGSKVLATPKPVVEPVTLSEGDETAVTVTWDAIDNAASYIVIFNKRAQDPQTGLSFTVPAEDIAALKAGLYNFTVQAFPREDDIYYTKSEQGSASVAIQPKGGAEEQVEVTLTWDFSAADWQEQFAALGAVNTDIATADFTYDGLHVFWSSKSKYNTTFLQWGGKSSGTDRYVSFTAPEQGTLKVWASNTGNSEDLTRMVTVAVGDDVQSLAGGYASGGGAVEVEFSVAAGEVKIYPTGNGLRFYKIEFTYTTGAAAAVEYDWDFAAADWQEQFGALGAVNTDIATADFTYDGLHVFWSSKCKYNTTFLQWGGKSSGTDRYVSFTAPEQGTLKVWASNTGNSEDLTRMVTVAVGDDVQSLPGGYASGGGAVEVEFSVAAGEVKIYPTGNGLRFYRIYYTNK